MGTYDSPCRACSELLDRVTADGTDYCSSEQTQRSTLPPWPKAIFRKLFAARLLLPLSELQQAMEETNFNRSSPSSVANSPNHDKEDELFPLSSAAKVAQLSLLDSTVIQCELAETRSWIASEKRIIVYEMEAVTSVMF